MKLPKSWWGAGAILTAAAAAGLLAVPGTARAAVTGTGATASMTFQSATVAAGTRPQLTFITSSTPAGAVVYLQEEATGEPWRSIGRIRALSGTVDAPADSAGGFEYRISVASGTGTTIATSAPVALTVTGPASGTPVATASGGGDSCAACKVVKDALPWLALVVDPSTVWSTITSVLTAIGGAILAFFGF